VWEAQRNKLIGVTLRSAENGLVEPSLSSGDREPSVGVHLFVCVALDVYVTLGRDKVLIRRRLNDLIKREQVYFWTLLLLVRMFRCCHTSSCSTAGASMQDLVEGIEQLDAPQTLVSN
jgi:hypothetical protein